MNGVLLYFPWVHGPKVEIYHFSKVHDTTVSKCLWARVTLPVSLLTYTSELPGAHVMFSKMAQRGITFSRSRCPAHFCIKTSIHLRIEMSMLPVQSQWVILLAFSHHLVWEGRDATSPICRRGLSLTSQTRVSKAADTATALPSILRWLGNVRVRWWRGWHCLVSWLFRMP